MSQEKNENINIILDIMRNNYNQYYQRTQNLDVKSGLFIAFHSAMLLFVLDFDFLYNTLNFDILNKVQIVKMTVIVVNFVALFMLSVLSISLFMYGLFSRNIKYMPATICNEVYYNSPSEEFKRRLLEGYKEIEECNESILDEKHFIFNIAVFFTILEIVLCGISVILRFL